MNKYIKIIAGFLALFLVSCEDFLDKNPTTQISSPTFWKTQSDADMALAGCYARLNCNTFNFEGVYSLDVMAGDANEGGQSLGASSTGTFALGIMEATSGGILANVYNDCYRGIATANIFMDNINRVEMTSDLKAIYIGEAKFLRALFYFNLADLYGGVPLYTAPVTIEKSKVAKATREEVIAQVIKDLDDAIAALPDIAYNGHAVKGSAQALKVRVLMWKSDWSAAAALAQTIMGSGIFSLYTAKPWKTIFLAEGQGSDNKEIMFSTKYLNPDNSSQQDIRILWHGIWNPRVELRNAFECTDGLPISQSPLYDPNNWKANRDPRLLETMRRFEDPAVKANGQVVAFAYNGVSLTGLEPAKGGNVETLPIDYSTKSEQDWVLLRYAEVLLNFAEATNEASGPTQAVYDAVNAVRARVAMPALPAGLSQADMRARIRNERRVEFAFEGMRYYDIRRWGIAQNVIEGLVDPGSNAVRHYPDKCKLWPFPQSEVDVNPQLVQNPGY